MIDAPLCEKQTRWLAHPDYLIREIEDAVKKHGCYTIRNKYNLTIDCNGCTVYVTIRETNTQEMIKALGTLALEAVKQGHRALSLEIKAPQHCTSLCKTIDKYLMKGGG